MRGLPRKTIFTSHQSPGDIVMLTAAVRDLHKTYPRKFLTGVRTPCPDIWLNNQYITSLSEDDPEVEVIECHYPLIHESNNSPYHFIHGFIDFLNKKLDLRIRPTEFCGDIHLSALEKEQPLTGGLGDEWNYWLIVSGGKYDYTIKWWSVERYQRVVNQLRDRVVFVQVGEIGHHHPALQGVVDLRGQTSLRDLIRLVYFADGCLGPVSLLMHLAPAIEPGPGRISRRPCVVIAGGREPPHWEAYPTHAFLHTVGMLPCCSTGGRWRSRTKALGDGDEKDKTENLCVDVVGELPRCMAMVTPEDVSRAIERYQELANIERAQVREKMRQ